MPGVYISYPFCAQKCTYCNFASGVSSRELEREYVRRPGARDRQPPLALATRNRLPRRRHSQPHGRRSISNVSWPRSPAAPGAKPPSKPRPAASPRELALDWSRAGINRVSLGVQSFVERELKRTGRKHTAAMVAREIETLRRAPASPNINIDLIAGLPGQTRDSWRESLAWIERLAPPHVSVYMLEVDADSRLGNEVLLNGKRYGAPEIPSDELIAELYETAVARARPPRHPPLRDFELRPARFRVAAQSEVLAARAVLRLRRRRAFLRWGRAQPECRNGRRIRRSHPRRPIAALHVHARQRDRRALLRRPAPLGRHPPATRRVAQIRRAHPPLPLRGPARARAAINSASPIAACYSPTKCSPNS